MRIVYNRNKVRGPQQVKYLVVAPHADDETLGCGGLLAKYQDECAVVVLTKPEDTRAKEFGAAQEVLGYSHAYFLDLPDGYLGTEMHTLVGLLDSVVYACRPQQLYIPYPSMHQDHIAAYEAGMRSARLSMSRQHWFPANVMAYDVAAYDLTLYPVGLQWNVFESLEEVEVDRKVEALLAYASLRMLGPHPVNGIKQQAHTVGHARQVAWAEQYALVRMVRV